MKKFTNLLIVCSLALAGAVMAQPPSPEESPSKKPEKKQPAATTQAPKPEAPAVKEPAAALTPAVPKPEKKAPKPEAPAVKEPAAALTPAVPKPDKKAPKPETPAATEKTTEQPAASATPAAKRQPPSKETMKAPATPAPVTTPAAAKTTASPAATKATTPAAPKMTATPAAAAASATPAAAKESATPAAPASASPAAAASATPAATAAASAAPSVAQTNPTTAPVNPNAAKKPEPQVVQQIRTKHENFHAQARPDRVPPVTFNASFRIQGSDRWQGPQYEVYRSYRPERHDRGWYHSRYKRVELIAGGYYYWNNGYWSPAWGYSPTEEYYAYDAPIYVGPKAEPPDKVIANVQAVLQEMGYYKGEVDGLFGPLTREALTGYQTDQGLTATAVIDEPTLNSLGMG